MVKQGNILSLGKFRVKKKLEDAGLQWIENREEKVAVWIRLNKKAKENDFEPAPRCKVLEFNSLDLES